MFDDIRPYNDSEIPAAIARVAVDPFFSTVVRYLFPNEDVESFRTRFMQIKTVRDFQEQVMDCAIQSVLRQTSSGFTCEGFEKLEPGRSYMFVANHRDILLDAAILQVVLNQSHLPTSEITFGSNLMQGQMVIDIGKMNKMFRIMRGGTRQDFYRNLKEVSAYMRYTLLQKHSSVWIAQRNGRTKDGMDKTESALLKMFATSSDKPFVENLSELNITPVAVSYEYEPCDFLKTQELYISQYQPYIKEEGEDLHSILRGITQQKGRIHLAMAPTIGEADLQECDKLDRNARFAQLARLIDQQIYQRYRLFPTNYIACDILSNTNRYESMYDSETKVFFEQRMQKGLSMLQGDEEELRSIFLSIYANPVLRGREDKE